MTSTRERCFRDVASARLPALLRSAYLLTQSADAAQDLVQEALTRTYGRLTHLDDVDAIEGYVRRAMTSIFIDGVRRRRFRVRESALAQPEARVPAETDAVDDRDQLRRILGQLPRRGRACLVLRFYEDRSVEQTADLLGWSPGAVKRETHDALKLLRGLEEVSRSVSKGDDNGRR